jgi:hypothetical protein
LHPELLPAVNPFRRGCSASICTEFNCRIVIHETFPRLSKLLLTGHDHAWPRPHAKSAHQKVSERRKPLGSRSIVSSRILEPPSAKRPRQDGWHALSGKTAATQHTGSRRRPQPSHGTGKKRKTFLRLHAPDSVQSNKKFIKMSCMAGTGLKKAASRDSLILSSLGPRSLLHCDAFAGSVPGERASVTVEDVRQLGGVRFREPTEDM